MSISREIEQVYERLIANSDVQKGLQFIQADSERTLQEQIEITEIPAPTFEEQVRGEAYQRKLIDLGLKEVRVDRAGNVFGVRPGTGKGPKIFVSAHLDTVFPNGTDTVANIREGRVYAPGIADDGRGLTVVLGLIRALDDAGIRTVGDIVFGATVGEEGLGDLRGVKAFFQDQTDIDGFISIEPGEPERTTYLATGSRRYRVTYRGTGGHSFGSFGLPSAIHALGRAIAKISDIQPPADPKTIFNVGTIAGGTSVNTIAQHSEMLIDMRSTDQEELLRLEAQILAIVEQAKVEENKRWHKEDITVKVERVGDRPAGSQPADARIVQAALAATKALGFEPRLDAPSSTDSNVPIHLGIPAVTLGGGGQFGGTHTLEEYFEPTDAHYGVQKIFLTVLGLVGVAAVSDPILPLSVKGTMERSTSPGADLGV